MPPNWPLPSINNLSSTVSATLMLLKNAAQSFLFLESLVTIISVYHHHPTRSEQTLRWQGTELFRFFFFFPQISQLIFHINLTIQPLITKEAVDFDGTRLQSLLAALVTSSVQLLRGYLILETLAGSCGHKSIDYLHSNKSILKYI